MYLIIDNNNIIIDYSNTISYLKRISETGLYVITQDFFEATMVKSNRTGECYYLKQDVPVLNYVYIEQIENEKIDYIICGYSKFANINDSSSILNDIQEIQQDKQNENKQKFNEYLNANPVEFNGKKYGTTLEDQLEINLILSQTQAAVTGTQEEPKVQWHAKNEVNEDISISDLLALQVAIKEVVAAPYKKMQEYKAAIFDCDSPKELSEMTFEY